MSTITVIGAAGTIGREVGAFLESWGEDVLALDSRFEGRGRVDASDPDLVAAALAGTDVCVNCVDYRLNMAVMRGALDAGTHYVDLGGLFHVTREQLGLGDEYARAGLTAILGMGSAPGKTNLLAAAAIERLGAPPRALAIWAATRDPAAQDHPCPAPYSVRTLQDELQLRPVVVHNGQLTEVEPLSGEAERDFPEPIGRVKGIYTLHSELATLPVAYPSLERASFRLSLSPGLLEKLLTLGDGEVPEPYTQSAESVAAHLVEVESAERSITGMTLTHGGSARSTAEPPARAAAEIASGRLEAPGVEAPERAIENPEAFLALLDTKVHWS